MDSVPAPASRRRRLNPSPEPLVPDAPTGPPIAASPGSPGRRGPPQEPSPQPPNSATPASPRPPCRRRRPPPQEPSPQPPVSATPAAAATSQGPLGLAPPGNPIPQTRTAASSPPTLLIEDRTDCLALFSPGSVKIIAIISKKFSLDDLPLLESLIKDESSKPQELQGFVVANPEIISELRRKKKHLARLHADPEGCHPPPHEPGHQPPLSVVPAPAPAAATASIGPPGLPGSPPEPRPQLPSSVIPPPFPYTRILQPPPDIMALPTTPFVPPTFLIADREDFRALASHASPRVVAIISPRFPLDQLHLLEATIATELNKPQEYQRFVVGNPEILSDLQRRREFVLTSARSLDVKFTSCVTFLHRLEEMKNWILSVGGISLEGIDRQINIVASAVAFLREKRLRLQREHRM